MPDLPPWRVPRYFSGLPHERVLDLSHVSFVNPSGVVSIATHAEAEVRGGAMLSVVAPRDEAVARYLSRARLPRLLDELGTLHNFVPVTERDLGLSLVELTRFSSYDDVNVLARSVYAFAEPNGEESAAALHTAVCEAGENVTVHAGIGHGYLVAQYFPRNRAFEFALGDSGVGFLGSLRAIGAADVGEALELAGRIGISSTGDPNRGLGIPSIRDELVGLGGQLVLAGEDRQRFFTADHPEGRSSVNTGSIVGSLVYGKFSAS